MFDESPSSLMNWPLAEWFWYPVTFMYGAIVGSFLNVLIYRLPMEIDIRGKSYCPNCKNYLRWYHNIPLFSFLFLRARCGFCKVPISWRYFMVELLSASAWMALFHQISERTGISWVNFVAHALFASVLIAMVYIDLDHFIAPDELNWTGIALGVGRDIVCLGLAWYAGSYIWQEFAPQFLYFGWLPKSLTGAFVYGGLLWLVSFVGFVYYAKEPWESTGQVARRFFTFEDATPPPPGFTLPPEDSTPPEEELEEAGDPPRLRFAPGFVAALAALILAPVIGAWAILVFLLPLSGFLLLSRREGEGQNGVLQRFFQADDQAGTNPEAPAAIVPETTVDDNGVERSLTVEEMQALSDEFAREAETGKHGGMGLGDVKLALAIGAVLGPWLAILSLFFATMFGAVTGILIARRHGRSLRYGLPFVPFMAAGAIVVMLFGPQIITWYRNVSGLNRVEENRMPEPPARRRPSRSAPQEPRRFPPAPLPGQ